MEPLRQLRENPVAAHIGPLAAFLVLSLVPGWFRVEGLDQPWYLRQPEHWWYPVQTLLCAGLLAWWWRHYRFPSAKFLPYGLAAVGACVGIAVWVLPGWLFQQWHDPSEPDPGWWRWLGLVDRSEGFDPGLLSDHPGGAALTICLRFARSVLVVPLVEELCWRAWLMRQIVAGERPFTAVPFGTHTWRAYGITTLAVVLVHSPVDWPAAFVWGSLVYLLAVKTRSLRACVLMHALGNLLLGIYALRTGQFGYW